MPKMGNVMTDLDKLIEAVDAGDNRFSSYLPSGDAREWPSIYKAMDGSLDAAHRLHEALLPGWRVHDFSQYSTFWAIVLNGEPPPHFFHGKAETPARAWLLAILRALKAKGDHNGTV